MEIPLILIRYPDYFHVDQEKIKSFLTPVQVRQQLRGSGRCQSSQLHEESLQVNDAEISEIHKT